MAITCPKCGMTSYNPNDEEFGYCGNCREFTGRSKMELAIVVVKDEFFQDVFIVFDPILKESLRTKDRKEAAEWAKAREESFEWPEE